MEESSRELRGRLLPTPFVSSWVGQAREGDLRDPDPARRVAAWAHWAVLHLVEIPSSSTGPYPALSLDGSFHVPKGRSAPTQRPHLALPDWVLSRPDEQFPARLAQMGNGLSFSWWVYPEVRATRRALFSTARGSLGELLALLDARHGALAEAVLAVSERARAGWGDVEELQHSDPASAARLAADPFSVAEVGRYFADGAGLSLQVSFDAKLREESGKWVGRRVGVWQISGVEPSGSRFSLGVLTPRLTLNSMFRDQLFAPGGESAAALLVRGLVLSRIVEQGLGRAGGAVEVARTGPKVGSLRSVVAQPGAKIPEAGVTAAVHFLAAYPDAADAWSALSAWAARTNTQLTVVQSAYSAAHRNARRHIARAEDPERDDINTVLPLGWDDRSRIVRVTYVRPDGE